MLIEQPQYRKGKTMTGLALVLLAVGMGVTGQLLLKHGVDGVSGASGAPAVLWHYFLSWPVLAGLGCYFAGALAWINVLSRFQLSYVYPMLALNYVLAPLAARYVFAEAIPPARWLGIGIICFGVLVVVQSR